ncbi:hypothetical protein LTR49_026892 [Elasticomyces elasticus]|nr:hypothetical protein LTR49_026892 [Elasticomyces elasticus]
MAPKHRSHYFVYREGSDSDLLRLGSLCLDYANPRTTLRTYYHHDTAADVKHDAACKTTVDEREYVTIAWNNDSDVSFDAGVDQLAKIGYSSEKASFQLIAVLRGSYKAIFNEQPVLEWLQARLSIAHSLTADLKYFFSRFSIWMLVGIYLVDNARVHSVSSGGQNANLDAKMPLPEPTGLAALAGATVGGSFHLSQNVWATARSKILGRKVWAGQWIKIKARYCDPSAEKPVVDPKQIKLLSVWSQGTEREDDDRPGTALLSLAADGAETEAEEQLTEAEWAKFDSELDQLLEDLED